MKENTTIVIVARSLPLHGIGGMEVVCWDLCSGLAERGYKVIVITTQLPYKTNNVIHKNVQIVSLEKTKPGRYSQGWWREVSKYFATLDSETISAVISISAAGVSLLKYREKFNNTKFIMQAHGTSFAELVSKLKTNSLKKWVASGKNLIWFFKDWSYYRKFDYVVSIGDAVTESLKTYPTKYITKDVEIVQIDNGVNQDMFRFNEEARKKTRSTLGMSNDALLLLSVSRLNDQKGIDNNIRTFAEVYSKNSNSYYLICGDGEEKKNLINICRELNVEKNVIFLGRMSREEIADLMSAADVFIFLTKRVEGLPLNVLEAMASGLPVIISEHLYFNENQKIRKSNFSDFNKAAGLVKELSSLGRPENRESHIAINNTLNYSVEKYCDLIAR